MLVMGKHVLALPGWRAEGCIGDLSTTCTSILNTCGVDAGPPFPRCKALPTRHFSAEREPFFLPREFGDDADLCGGYDVRTKCRGR